MTDKDLNKAIAAKLGWKPIPPIPGREHLFDGYMLKPDAKTDHDIGKVPDFTGSLDAIMSGIKSLCDKCELSMLTWMDSIYDQWDREPKRQGCTFAEWLTTEATAKSYAKAFACAIGILPVAGKEVEG